MIGGFVAAFVCGVGAVTASRRRTRPTAMAGEIAAHVRISKTARMRQGLRPSRPLAVSLEKDGERRLAPRQCPAIRS